LLPVAFRRVPTRLLGSRHVCREIRALAPVRSARARRMAPAAALLVARVRTRKKNSIKFHANLGQKKTLDRSRVSEVRLLKANYFFAFLVVFFFAAFFVVFFAAFLVAFFFAIVSLLLDEFLILTTLCDSLRDLKTSLRKG
jgi:hypothetical protein